jgi:hypothetical protein
VASRALFDLLDGHLPLDAVPPLPTMSRRIRHFEMGLLVVIRYIPAVQKPKKKAAKKKAR